MYNINGASYNNKLASYHKYHQTALAFHNNVSLHFDALSINVVRTLILRYADISLIISPLKSFEASKRTWVIKADIWPQNLGNY